MVFFSHVHILVHVMTTEDEDKKVNKAAQTKPPSPSPETQQNPGEASSTPTAAQRPVNKDKKSPSKAKKVDNSSNNNKGPKTKARVQPTETEWPDIPEVPSSPNASQPTSDNNPDQRNENPETPPPSMAGATPPQQPATVPSTVYRTTAEQRTVNGLVGAAGKLIPSDAAAPIGLAIRAGQESANANRVITGGNYPQRMLEYFRQHPEILERKYGAVLDAGGGISAISFSKQQVLDGQTQTDYAYIVNITTKSSIGFHPGYTQNNINLSQFNEGVATSGPQRNPNQFVVPLEDLYQEYIDASGDREFEKDLKNAEQRQLLTTVDPTGKVATANNIYTRFRVVMPGNLVAEFQNKVSQGEPLQAADIQAFAEGVYGPDLPSGDNAKLPVIYQRLAERVSAGEIPAYELGRYFTPENLPKLLADPNYTVPPLSLDLNALPTTETGRDVSRLTDPQTLESIQKWTKHLQRLDMALAKQTPSDSDFLLLTADFAPGDGNLDYIRDQQEFAARLAKGLADGTISQETVREYFSTPENREGLMKAPKDQFERITSLQALNNGQVPENLTPEAIEERTRRDPSLKLAPTSAVRIIDDDEAPSQGNSGNDTVTNANGTDAEQSVSQDDDQPGKSIENVGKLAVPEEIIAQHSLVNTGRTASIWYDIDGDGRVNQATEVVQGVSIFERQGENGAKELVVVDLLSREKLEQVKGVTRTLEDSGIQVLHANGQGLSDTPPPPPKMTPQRMSSPPSR